MDLLRPMCRMFPTPELKFHGFFLENGSLVDTYFWHSTSIFPFCQSNASLLESIPVCRLVDALNLGFAMFPGSNELGSWDGIVVGQGSDQNQGKKNFDLSPCTWKECKVWVASYSCSCRVNWRKSLQREAVSGPVMDARWVWLRRRQQLQFTLAWSCWWQPLMLSSQNTMQTVPLILVLWDDSGRVWPIRSSQWSFLEYFESTSHFTSG